MTRYTIRGFIDDAKKIMARDAPLAQRQDEFADRMSLLSKRDDLLRSGLAMGPADASTQNYLLWREKPYIFLGLAQFDQHYTSPIHEHDSYWVVACGYRGRDRWDMYERVDDQSEPGHADLNMYDQYDLPPGATAVMQPPPRSIHSHNNQFQGITQELIFSMAEPSDPNRRIVYDLDEKSARLSEWKPNGMYLGGDYPGPTLRTADRLRDVGERVRNFARQAFCPICEMARMSRFRADDPLAATA
ncbi:MAG TPA: hypothetical protein VMF90_04675 [Rhizobiaceae bacterium]|nr:hypothetical protein [Rhizobiaceae bacterium]